MEIIELEDNKFEDLIKTRVLVDFYANWCGPCKMLAPELVKASGDINVLKVDVDKHEDIARKYGVMSIPTLILFEDSTPVKQSVGFIDKDAIEEFIAK